jgi:hypothetical protein
LEKDQLIHTTIKTILKRSLQGGGFSITQEKLYRSDATAWAIIALEVVDGYRKSTLAACQRLAHEQLSDGRVTMIINRPETFWPTSLALMAWLTVPGFEIEADRAAKFLLSISGKHFPRKEDSPLAHDSALKGWPWIENTHSWIEPTSLAVLALKSAGYTRHERVLEAEKMILDRQISSGGWNYGNTRVFGTQLMPIPECTGHALSALADSVDRKNVALSIDYLNGEAERFRTPLALAWTIMGLGAWANRPADYRKWILDSLALQDKYGLYDTALLSQLVVAYYSHENIMSIFAGEDRHERETFIQ